MTSRTELLRDLGRSEFTVRQMADRVGVTVETARSRIARYVDEGLLERTDEVLQYVDTAGRPQRGRPAHLYRVR
jgi:predicted ArsR family transcriptional regulator